MGGFASIITKLLPELSEVAARELAPTAARMAPETIESVSKPVLEEIMAKGGGWLSELLGREAPGAAMAAPARAAAPAARELVQPEVSDPLYSKLGNFARQYLRESRLPGPSAIPGAEAAPFPGEIAASRAARASTYQPPPETAQMPSVAESVSSALQRPGEAESQEMVRRATEMEAGPQQEAAFARLKAILQRPGTIPSETQSELDRLMGREVPPPTAPEDFPVLRQPYRSPTPERTSTSMADLIRERGFKRPALPAQYKELLDQLVASGKVPSDMLRAQTPGSEAMGPELSPDIMERLFGSTKRALLGESQDVSSGSSTAGRILAQLRGLSPEQIIERIGKANISPIMQAGQRQARAEYGAEEMQRLGEQRPAKDIVADLLRGGPSPTGTGMFSEKVLYPIMQARAARNLPAGQPLGVEDILGALSGGKGKKFIQTTPSKVELPSTLKRKDFVMRVLKILQSMRGRGGQ